MNVLQRTGYSLSAARWAWRSTRRRRAFGSNTRGVLQKAAPFLLAAYRDDRPALRDSDYVRYAREAYRGNSVVYSGIAFKAKTMTAAPLRAYHGERASPELLDDADALAQLVDRPNKWMPWQVFHGLNVTYLNIAGDSFIYADRGENRATWPPQAMYPLRPDRVLILPRNEEGGTTIAGYLYVPEGKSAWLGWTEQERSRAIEERGVRLLMAEDVAHVKFPNPMDPLDGLGYGQAPLLPVADNIDIDNAVTSFINDFFLRGGIPPFWFSFAEEIDGDELAELREQIAEDYAGFRNWQKPGVMGKGMTVQRLGMTFQEMGFESIDQRNEARILSVLGVAPVLVGASVGLEHSTYSNYETADKVFWQSTQIPEAEMFEAAYRTLLAGPGDTFVAFDYSGVPALQADVVELVKAAVELIDRQVPPRTAFETVGLEVPPYDGDEAPIVPMGPGMMMGRQPAGLPAPAPFPKLYGGRTDPPRAS